MLMRALVAAVTVVVAACEASGPPRPEQRPPAEAAPTHVAEPPSAAPGTEPASVPAERAVSPKPSEEAVPGKSRARAQTESASGTGAAAAPAAAASGAPSAVTTAAAGPAASLRNRYVALSAQLEHSPFPQRLYIESIESPRALQGDIYALLDYPFALVSDAFATPAHWCDTLILHLNVKYCRATARDDHTVLSVAVGRKYDQPLADTYRLEFAFRAAAPAEDYMAADLDAAKGPLGTRDYHIALEAVALEDGRTFLHIRYAYAYGLLGRLALKIYLATSAGGKVGFTVVGHEKDGTPRLVGGVRGAIERNTMRYYLAIDASLGALATPPPQRFEQSLERWFTGTERYAPQLHEVDRNTYFAMKRREYLRQQTPR